MTVKELPKTEAIAGMFFDGTMLERAIVALTQRFENPAIIPAVQDENTSTFRLFVDNLHNFVRTLKTYDHEANLRAAANMQ